MLPHYLFSCLRVLSVLALGCCALLAVGCESGSSSNAKRVTTVVEERPPAPLRSDAPAAPPTVARETDDTGDVIAVVDGRPIGRERIVDLLLAGHGPGVLEQLVVLEAARRLAVERGVTVRPEDVQAEHERMLADITESLGENEGDVLDRQAGEAVLADILMRRNISMREYELGNRRNAYLRKLAKRELTFSEEEVRAEFERTYGARVQVRHIVVARLADAERIRTRLEEGASFAELAREYSLNRTTGRKGGLLPPFTADDPDVPAVLREAAWALEDGAVSSPLRVEGRYHIVRRERAIPALGVQLADVREELVRQMRERVLPAAIQRLYRRLYEEADITIYDPVLKAAVEGRREGPATRGGG